jgi:hypothetical protein
MTKFIDRLRTDFDGVLASEGVLLVSRGIARDMTALGFVQHHYLGTRSSFYVEDKTSWVGIHPSQIRPVFLVEYLHAH